MRRILPLALLLSLGCDPASPAGDAGTARDAAAVDVGPHDAGPPHDSGPRPDAGPITLGDHPRILVPAGSARRATLEARLTAAGPAAARWQETVDLAVAGGDVYAFRSSDAALLSVLTADASYCTWAVAQVDAFVAGEEALIAGGGPPEVAHDSYLYIGDDVGNLALVYDWCHDAVSTAQRDRWIAYANQAVWNVWHHTEATWDGGATITDWSGWSVDNPVNNYYYSFLEATMLLGLATFGENDMADAWLTQFRTAKIADQLVPTFDRDLVGGGSREGTGYGTAMRSLFVLYDLWESTTGERISDLTAHTLASLPYLIHATAPTLDRVAPIGDHARDSTASLFDYHRLYALAIMSLNAGDPLAGIGRSYLDACSVPSMGQRFMSLYDFLYEPSSITAAPLTGLHPIYRGTGTGHIFVRSSWDEDASYLAFIAGPYTESHAHHDQGSFVLFHREWLAFDENILSHSGIVQGETAHNLVRLVRGGEIVPMREGQSATLSALEVEGDAVFLSAEVAPVYDDASITSVARRILFLRPNVVVIEDRIATTDASTTAILGISSPIDTTVTGARATFDGASSDLDVRVVFPATAAITEVSWPAEDPDMSGGVRLDVASPAGTSARFVTVLGIDGAVTAATATAAAGSLTVAVTHTGGALTVTFPDSGVGASASIDGASVTFDGTIEEQPLFAP
jgi:hypothetical protein